MSDKEKQNISNEPAVDIGEDINVTTILTVGVVTALIVTIVVIILVGMFYQAESDYSTEINADLTDVKLIDLKQEQLENLASYGWVDPAEEVVSIPVDQAVELTIAELNADRLVVPDVQVPEVDEVTSEDGEVEVDHNET